MKHHEQEEADGQEIWPATPKHLVSEKNKEEIDFCKSLDCTSGNGPAELAW